MFHLLRVFDKGIRLVADSIGAVYENGNWGVIGTAIRNHMYSRAKDHSPESEKECQLYGAVLADIQGIGKAHRNPTLHELEQKYTEGEAEHLFALMEGFLQHLTDSGIRERYDSRASVSADAKEGALGIPGGDATAA